jgi:hypothetical protein
MDLRLVFSSGVSGGELWVPLSKTIMFSILLTLFLAASSIIASPMPSEAPSTPPSLSSTNAAPPVPRRQSRIHGHRLERADSGIVTHQFSTPPPPPDRLQPTLPPPRLHRHQGQDVFETETEEQKAAAQVIRTGGVDPVNLFPAGEEDDSEEKSTASTIVSRQ